MRKKKRILFVIPFLSSGGAERVVSIWTSELAKKGKDIHLLLFYRVDNEYQIDKAVNIHIIKKQKKSYDNLSFISKLSLIRRKLREIKPDIIIPFISHVGILLTVAKIGLDIKIIETIRNNPRTNPPTKTFRVLRNLSVLFADRVIVQNETQLKYFPEIIKNKTGIFFNPIDYSFLQHQKSLNKKTIDRIVAIGRLEDQKDYFTMINAFEYVIKLKPKMKLNIYGEGSLRAILNEYINDKKLQKHIKINNRTNNVAEVLYDNDLYILSSKWEGMPNSLMEAMAVGLPCISTDCETGPSDLIEDKTNGRLVPVGDSEAMAEAIIEMSENQQESIKMGTRARETILKYHTPEQSAYKLFKFIKNI